MRNTETADSRDSIPKSYVTACRALLDKPVCERCKEAPTVLATGNGLALCRPCADVVRRERRAALDQVGEMRRAIERARAWRG
jgi:hypothetical protein